MIESAPLQYNLIIGFSQLVSFFSFTITVSLFLSLVNSINSSLSKSIVLLFILPNFILFILVVPDSTNSHPWFFAALTSSIESGDTHAYSKISFSSYWILHVWHKANAYQNCSTNEAV